MPEYLGAYNTSCRTAFIPIHSFADQSISTQQGSFRGCALRPPRHAFGGVGANESWHQCRITKATFKEDFLTGPSNPPRPRPLYQVILFSISTNLLWYGYYKYCIEEELRATLGEGPGGIGALAPFMIGVTSPLYLPRGGPAEFGVAAGILWIVSLQYYLYKRINVLMREKGEKEPLTPWWVVVPGFNLIAGLRSVHFLHVAFGGEPEDDPVVQFFPFLGVKTLDMLQFVTKPSLWVKFGNSDP